MRFKIIIINFILILIAIQLSAFGTNELLYSMIRNLVFVSVIILFLLNFKKNILFFFTDKLIRKIFVFLFLFLCVNIILYGVLPINFSFSEIRDVLLVLVIIVISKNLTLNSKDFLSLSNNFIYTMTLSALTIPFIIGNGFVVNELYLPIPKNQISPIYVVAILTGLFILNSYNLSFFKKNAIISCCVLLFSVLLIIRGRTSILILLFSISFFYIFIYRKIKYFFILIFLLVLFSPLYLEILYNSLFLNYDINDLNSVTTGRSDVYSKTIFFIQDNFFYGKMNAEFKTETIVHNYILKILSDFGIFSFFLICIYFIFLAHISKIIFFSKNSFEKFISWLVLILFMVSLTEYTLPYSPGSTVFFVFFMFGQFDNINLKYKKC